MGPKDSGVGCMVGPLKSLMQTKMSQQLLDINDSQRMVPYYFPAMDWFSLEQHLANDSVKITKLSWLRLCIGTVIIPPIFILMTNAEMNHF